MISLHLPGAQQKRFWQKKWPREVLFNVPPIFAAGLAALLIFHNPNIDDPWILRLALIGVGWPILTMVARTLIARAEDQKDEPDVIHEGLYAAVSTMHIMLSEWCKKREYTGDIRATFHRVVPPIQSPQEIEQIIDYAGSNGDGVGRKFSVHTGITGSAVRNKTTLVMSSLPGTTENDLRTELIREWGYTESQARKLSPDRYSAMALPVLDRSGQHPIGVLYLDSNNHTLFERDDVREIVVAGAKAVGDVITKRY